MSEIVYPHQPPNQRQDDGIWVNQANSESKSMAWKSRQQSEQSDSLLFLKNLPTHVQEHVATNVHTIKIILDRKHGVIDDELDDEYV